MVPIPKIVVLSTIAALCMPIFGNAGVLEDFLREDESVFCGVDHYVDAFESSCAWDEAAKRAGDCIAPQYQEIVGKREIYRQCRTLLSLGEGYHLPASPPQDAATSVKKGWNLLKALQPIAAEAIKVPMPACVAGIKPYPQRKLKDDHVYYFNCMNERNISVSKSSADSNAGRVVSIISKALEAANFDDAQTMAAVNELTILLEDEGSKASLQEVGELVKRFR